MKRCLMLTPWLLALVACSSAWGAAAASPSGTSSESFAQTEPITFNVVPPDLSIVRSQSDIQPYLQKDSSPKFALPRGVPMYLKDGTEVTSAYLGYSRYTVDFIGSTWDGEVASTPEKIIVNQTHEEVTQILYYMATAHRFGKYYYFTCNYRTSGGEYYLPYYTPEEGATMLAGVRKTANQEISHIAYCHLLTDGDQTKEVAEWDYGPLLLQ